MKSSAPALRQKITTHKKTAQPREIERLH